MLTLTNIQTLIDSAKVYYLNQLAIIYADMQLGVNNISCIYPVRRLVRSLEYEHRAQVIDSGTEQIYDCLFEAIGGYTGLYLIDPEVQIPGQTVVEVPVVSNFNNDQLPINTTAESPQFILTNYQLNYKQLYGNNPFLAPYITAGGFNTGDEQTPPIITRVDPDDPQSDILSILFDYGMATIGYLNISGVGTISSGNPSGGGVVPLIFHFTQDDLLYDSVLDQYYLNLILPGTRRPFYASINGDSIPLNYSASTSRFNGFANNLPTQDIEIDLM